MPIHQFGSSVGSSGNSNNWHSGLRFQVGSGHPQHGIGLFSSISSIFKSLAPHLKSAVKATTSGLKRFANSSVGDSLKTIAKDTALQTGISLLNNEDPLDSLQAGVDKAKSSIASALESKLSTQAKQPSQQQSNSRKRKRKKGRSHSTKVKRRDFNLLQDSP